MNSSVTYPLHEALDLCPEWGAVLQTETMWVRVIPKLGWQVAIRAGEHMVYTICETREACIQFLQRNAYPLDHGWRPDLPVSTAPQPVEEVELEHARLH
jgi:hypothetical protein